MLIWQVHERLCVVYLLTRDSLVLWALTSLPDKQYNLLRSLNPGIFSDKFFICHHQPEEWEVAIFEQITE